MSSPNKKRKYKIVSDTYHATIYKPIEDEELEDEAEDKKTKVMKLEDSIFAIAKPLKQSELIPSWQRPCTYSVEKANVPGKMGQTSPLTHTPNPVPVQRTQPEPVPVLPQFVEQGQPSLNWKKPLMFSSRYKDQAPAQTSSDPVPNWKKPCTFTRK